MQVFHYSTKKFERNVDVALLLANVFDSLYVFANWNDIVTTYRRSLYLLSKELQKTVKGITVKYQKSKATFSQIFDKIYDLVVYEGEGRYHPLGYRVETNFLYHQERNIWGAIIGVLGQLEEIEKRKFNNPAALYDDCLFVWNAALPFLDIKRVIVSDIKGVRGIFNKDEFDIFISNEHTKKEENTYTVEFQFHNSYNHVEV